MTDVFARVTPTIPQLLCHDVQSATAFFAAPEGADPVEWQVLTARANAAAARLLWPLGERGLAKRLHRIEAPTLLVWGAEERSRPGTTPHE